MQSLALFGGAFDPIHYGHLQTSIAIQDYFHFDQYLFLPCKTPTLKAATLANSQQRLEMLQLALQNYPQFKIDTREINRDSPSYMFETLSSFRDDYPQDSLTLIIGYDAFLSLPQWYQWEKLIGLTNFIVINRGSFQKGSISKKLENLLSPHQSLNTKDILTHKAGNIVFFDAGDYHMSSTSIREKVKQGQHLEQDLPCEVIEYIQKTGLYRCENG